MRYCHAYNEEFSKYRKSHNFSFFNNLFFVPFVFVFVFVFFVLFLCGSRGPESSMRLKKLLWIVLLIFRLDLIVVKMSYLVDDVSWSFYLKGSYMLQLYLFVKIFSIQYSVFSIHIFMSYKPFYFQIVSCYWDFRTSIFKCLCICLCEDASVVIYEPSNL